MTTRNAPMVPVLLISLSLAAAACDSGADEDEAELDPSDPEFAHQHCAKMLPYPADLRDEDPGEIEIVTFGEGSRDVRMPPGVMAWLEERGWLQQHDDWHRVRRWDQGCRLSNATVEGPDGVEGTEDDCSSAKALVAEGLWRSPIQENAPGDGFAFLVMHRHMLQGVREAFPSHPELFDGWEEVPRSKDHPENLMPWRNVSWSSSQLEAIEILEHIEDHVDRFPTEDDLARYIQAPFLWTEDNPSQFQADGSAGIHFMFHAQWSVFGSPVELGNGPTVIANPVFWQLHGFIDDVWERYRVAKGIGDDDEAYVDELMAQCWEMHELGEAASGGH